MSAIITNQFRKNSRELFINDIGDSTTDDYFIGIGNLGLQSMVLTKIT